LANKILQGDEAEGIKLQFEALMDEYKMVRDMVADHRQMQSQLDNIALASMGVSIPLILTVLDRNPSAIGVILLIPILFFSIAFTQYRHERLLTISAMYVDAELRPRIEKLLTKLRIDEAEVLGFEKFLSKRSWAPHLLLEWLAIPSAR
jgi:hypothetical protein